MQNTSGFAPEQLGASADQALRFLDQVGADATRLVEAWIQAGNTAAVQTAAELGEGPARKVARRGLNVLKARGVNVPAMPRAARIEPSIIAAREAWLLPPDAAGVEGIVFAERQPSGSYQACFVFFRDGRELLRVQSGQLSLSRIKENMQQSLGGAGYSAVSVPWAWAQFRVAERRAWHAVGKVPEPLGWMGAERFLRDAPTLAPPHPFDERGLAPAPEEVETLVRDSGLMHQWPEFRAWLPGERAVQELLLHIGRRMGPTPPTAKEEVDPLIREQVAAATDRYFTPERRAVLASRLKDSGLSVLARVGESAARQVAALVHVIQGAGLITNPPSGVKFLTAYFDKAIALMAAQQGGRLRVPVPAPLAGVTSGDAIEESDPLGEEASRSVAAEEPASTADAPVAAEAEAVSAGEPATFGG